VDGVGHGEAGEPVPLSDSGRVVALDPVSPHESISLFQGLAHVHLLEHQFDVAF
jgi:hypothetical protein